MAMISAQTPCSAPSAYVARIETMADQFGGVFETDSIRSIESDIRVAGATYPLRRPCSATYLPVAGEFLVEGFSPMFIGQGKTFEESREDWQLRVHASFQKLLHKRPFEMTAEDKLTWSVLSSIIDVAVYRNQTPIQVRQFGRISKARHYPRQIRWESGEYDAINLEQVDNHDFINFKAGQPFEAIVARDPVSFQLLRIVHINRRSEPKRLPSAEESSLLDSIGSATALPEASWE